MNFFRAFAHWLRRPKVPEIMQFEVTECGTCCLGMVLAFFGRWEPLDHLREICGATRDGVSAGALARAVGVTRGHEPIHRDIPRLLFVCVVCVPRPLCGGRRRVHRAIAIAQREPQLGGGPHRTGRQHDPQP